MPTAREKPIDSHVSRAWRRSGSSTWSRLFSAPHSPS